MSRLAEACLGRRGCVVVGSACLTARERALRPEFDERMEFPRRHGSFPSVLSLSRRPYSAGGCRSDPRGLLVLVPDAEAQSWAMVLSV